MEKKNIAQPGQKDQTQSKKEFFNESLSHQGMVIDCYFYKNCKDQNLIQEQKVNSELKLFLKQQRYALYEISDNPTQTQVMDVLEQGIKSNFSPSLKTFVLNLNGNAKIYPTSTNDILFMLKYDKAYKDTSNSFKTQIISDKNSQKNSKQTQLESNEVNLLKILLLKLQKYYAKYKIDVVVIYDVFVENQSLITKKYP
eukprot:403371362